VLCEPDGTFDPAGLWKLLPFTVDTDVVFGSRTVQVFIWDGANMGLFLRWGNWAVAKLIEVIFGTAYLSDLGCTTRVMHRHVVDALLPRSRLTGSAFGLELLMHSISPAQVRAGACATGRGSASQRSLATGGRPSASASR
jgi:hypothetical protein